MMLVALTQRVVQRRCVLLVLVVGGSGATCGLTILLLHGNQYLQSIDVLLVSALHIDGYHQCADHRSDRVDRVEWQSTAVCVHIDRVLRIQLHVQQFHNSVKGIALLFACRQSIVANQAVNGMHSSTSLRLRPMQ